MYKEAKVIKNPIRDVNIINQIETMITRPYIRWFERFNLPYGRGQTIKQETDYLGGFRVCLKKIKY